MYNLVQPSHDLVTRLEFEFELCGLHCKWHSFNYYIIAMVKQQTKFVTLTINQIQSCPDYRGVLISEVTPYG